MIHTMSKRNLLVIGVMSISFIGVRTAYAFGAREIVAEGRASGTNINAMEQAKQDALRRAVEQACGTFINAQSKTGNYALVYDKVISEPLGYIEEYKVLEERVADGVSCCKVRAVVSTASFEREWARLAHTLVAEDNPRCMVVVVEDNGSSDPPRPRTNGIVQNTLENFFLDKGLRLVDKGAVDDRREREITLAALNDDVRQLAATAASLHADVIIKGNAEARRTGDAVVAGKSVYKWRATLNVRAYHADSAQMLMSQTYTTSHSSVAFDGGDEALKRCVEQEAAKVLRDIGESWRKRQNVTRTIQIVLSDCSRADFKSFEAALRKVDGVQDVKLREMTSGVCQIDVDWSYDAERLAGRLDELKLPGMSLEITSQTHERLTVKLIK